jgi:hypothetical protein
MTRGHGGANGGAAGTGAREQVRAAFYRQLRREEGARASGTSI